MTTGERLTQLSGLSGVTAAVMLLAIGTGVTTGAALVNYSQLPTGTAEEHLLVDRVTTKGGWLPLRKRKEDSVVYPDNHVIEREDKEARLKFIKELLEGKVEAPLLKKSIATTRKKVRNVDSLAQIYRAEEILLKAQKDVAISMEEAYQAWLRRYDGALAILLLTAYP